MPNAKHTFMVTGVTWGIICLFIDALSPDQQLSMPWRLVTALVAASAWALALTELDRPERRPPPN